MDKIEIKYYSELVHMLFVDAQNKSDALLKEFDNTRQLSQHERELLKECIESIDELMIMMGREGDGKIFNPMLLGGLGYL